MIPYAVKTNEVTAEGFIRDEPSLFERIMKRYEQWHLDRKDKTVSSNFDQDSVKRKDSILDEIASRSNSKMGFDMLLDNTFSPELRRFLDDSPLKI